MSCEKAEQRQRDRQRTSRGGTVIGCSRQLIELYLKLSLNSTYGYSQEFAPTMASVACLAAEYHPNGGRFPASETGLCAPAALPPRLVHYCNNPRQRAIFTEYNFSEYAHGWPPRGYKLAVSEAKRKCLIASSWWRTSNGG